MAFSGSPQPACGPVLFCLVLVLVGCGARTGLSDNEGASLYDAAVDDAAI
jgi:hypothetical protein